MVDESARGHIRNYGMSRYKYLCHIPRPEEIFSLRLDSEDFCYFPSISTALSLLNTEFSYDQIFRQTGTVPLYLISFPTWEVSTVH
jgi:hypothetical protein